LGPTTRVVVIHLHLSFKAHLVEGISIIPASLSDPTAQCTGKRQQAEVPILQIRVLPVCSVC